MPTTEHCRCISGHHSSIAKTIGAETSLHQLECCHDRSSSCLLYIMPCSHILAAARYLMSPPITYRLCRANSSNVSTTCEGWMLLVILLKHAKGETEAPAELFSAIHAPQPNHTQHEGTYQITNSRAQHPAKNNHASLPPSGRGYMPPRVASSSGKFSSRVCVCGGSLECLDRPCSSD